MDGPYKDIFGATIFCSGHYTNQNLHLACLLLA